MSKILKKERNFLLLLFSTTTFQARALLETATSNQVRIIREIILNLLDPEFKFPDSTKKVIARRQKLLRQILNNNKNTSDNLIAKHSRLVLDSLFLVRKRILALI